MSPSAQQRAKRQQRVEELCAASLRALTGNADLHYRGRQLHQGLRRVPLLAPHLRVDSDEDDFSDCRGAADGTALRLLHSDPDIHREFCPGDDERIARLMFEWLEQMRVETLVRDDMPGMRHNLQQRFAHWSTDFYRAGLTEGRLGILLYTAAQMCWSRLTAQRVLEETEDHIEGTRLKLASRIGTPLAGIRRHRFDQRQFAHHALGLARTIGDMTKGEHAEDGRDDKAQEDAEDQEEISRFALLLEFDQGEGDTPALATSGESKVFAAADQGYRIHTTRYDTEVDAKSLLRPALLREYREKLDRRVAAQGINIPHLARLLHALLARPDSDGWLFGEEEGYIDGRRLAQLISSPAERRIFRQDRQTPVSNCLVSLLVDCSGSMKTHIEAVATLIDILLRSLEMASVTTELLGFTTGAWNGGRAWRDWQRAGEPAHPGRLNESCHMIFKSADRSWRRSRAGIAGLLKADLFREGVDGEAVDWACQRMLARGEPRRILIVISDGCPSDAATGRANDVFYLDNHLKDVVARREREDAVEIMGLGVGLDLSPFYLNSLATDMTQALDNALFHEIVQLIGRRHRR
ncbi:MAG: cobalt chelatase [Burkholderiaceae bacterium]|nr:cobalt chelatase [Burkholderiaceae bacterium]